MNRTITVTAAARNFADLVNRAWYRGEETTLLKGGEPVAVVGPVGGAVVSGRDLAVRWATMPHLEVDDAADFESAVLEARGKLGMPASPWD